MINANKKGEKCVFIKRRIDIKTTTTTTIIIYITTTITTTI